MWQGCHLTFQPSVQAPRPEIHCLGDGTHNNQYSTIHAHLLAGFPFSGRTDFIVYFYTFYSTFYTCGLTDSSEVCSNPLICLIITHANCMQHVLRCQERQSGGTECKKTLRRPGLRSGPSWGSLQLSPVPLAGGEGWLPFPKNPIPLSALRASPLLFPHCKIVPLSAPTWFRLATPLTTNILR